MASKTKITCFKCNASFLFDLSKLSADIKEKKCIKCGTKIPLLRRIIEAKNEPAKKKIPKKVRPKENKDSAESANGYMSFLAQGSGEGDIFALSADQEGDGASWLATFGDIMSLLLIFFILLFAISSVDQNKFEMVMSAIGESLGGNPTFAQVVLSDKEIAMQTMKEAMREEQLVISELYKKLTGFIVQNNLQEKIGLSDEDEYLILITIGTEMFDGGKSELRPEVRPLLKKMSEILSDIDNDIIVEGHTDDVPIHTEKFASNWELSSIRAANVVHFLIGECHMSSARFSVAGYSHYKPRFSFTATNAHMNRRIEILVKKKYSNKMAKQILAVE
jgi:chemotaxis protein MotB